VALGGVCAAADGTIERNLAGLLQLSKIEVVAVDRDVPDRLFPQAHTRQSPITDGYNDGEATIQIK